MMVKKTNVGSVDLQLDKKVIRNYVLLLRALDHPIRQKMLKILTKKEQVIVKEFTLKLQLEPAVTSQHLAILKKIGLVSADRHGRNVSYSLNQQKVLEVNQLLN